MGAPQRQLPSVQCTDRWVSVRLVGLPVDTSLSQNVGWHLEVRFVGGSYYQGPTPSSSPICSVIMRGAAIRLVGGSARKGGHMCWPTKRRRLTTAFLPFPTPPMGAWRSRKCPPLGMGTLLRSLEAVWLGGDQTLPATSSLARPNLQSPACQSGSDRVATCQGLGDCYEMTPFKRQAQH